jgi:glycosidase
MPTSIKGPDVQKVFDQAQLPSTKRISLPDKTVEIHVPFPSPEDWRDQWIYFLMVDRFNNPQNPPHFAPFDGEFENFQGGIINGVREQLDYLKQLGVGAIWLSPVLKNCQYRPQSYHGYGIQDFLQVDPRFASDPEAAKANPEIAENELIALVDEAHARNIYVIFDIVLHHAGDVFEYILDDGTHAPQTNWRKDPYTINWRDQDGHGRPDWTAPPTSPPPDALVWPKELQNNDFFGRHGSGDGPGDDFESLKGIATGVQFTDQEGFQYYPVRNILIRAYQYIIAKFDVDGYRIDTLKFIEPEFAQVFGNAMREFAESIGKKNFFTFGEVYDNEDKIAGFIGRNVTQQGDLVGVDAALDFPLFYLLPAVAKGLHAPSEVIDIFQNRKEVEKYIISSHGEAGRFFVTFLDNHDQNNRMFFSSPDDPTRYSDQLTLGVGCLFTLQGIPCIYYGTEQGLHGSGDRREAVREALWGKPDAFNRDHPFYAAIERLAAIRERQPALRYGRQYFRPISGDGVHFGISTFYGGVLAFSRILNDREVLIVANTNTSRGWEGEVIVDLALNPKGSTYLPLFTNKTQSESSGRKAIVPSSVIPKAVGQVEIHEIDGRVTQGPARALMVSLEKMEIQILAKTGE